MRLCFMRTLEAAHRICLTVACRLQDLLPLPSVAGLGPQDSQRAAVLPSIGSALEWLRKCVRERPNLRVQVLPTGPAPTNLRFPHIVALGNILRGWDADINCLLHALALIAHEQLLLGWAGACDRVAVLGGRRAQAPQEGLLTRAILGGTLPSRQRLQASVILLPA